MFQILLVAAVVMAIAMSYSGIVKGEMKVSAQRTVRGTPARVLGALCLVLPIALGVFLYFLITRK
ncbi:MAG: hypothetical protein K8T20_19955 [Planctomycetes bacterium]|nr:hypothetical protein [Planctomycetota bacterium]